MFAGGSTRFSLVAFAVAVVTIGVGTAAGLALVPLVGSYLGMLLGGLVTALATDTRPLVASGLAAALANLGVLVAGAGIGNGVAVTASSLGSVGPVALLISTGLAFAVGAFGAHFGDDLRDGLTAPVESTPGMSGESGTVTTPRDVDSREATSQDPETESTDRVSGGDAPAEGSTGDQSEADESADLELERE